MSEGTITKGQNSQRIILGRVQQRYTTVAESRFRNIYRPAAHPVGLWNGGDVSDFLPHSRLDTGEWLHGRSCQQERGDTQRLQCCILV